MKGSDMMRSGFTRGMIIGSIIGASVSMMVNPDMMKSRGRRKMMRNGKNILRKSGNIIGDVVDLFR
ncbi:MAG: YtxH domain-containing protein [Clostridia bacterium]|nr:YtxH domain-containing protein [Clostridia bacterium]